MKELLNHVFWRNSVADYCIVLAGILLTWIIFKITRKKVLVIVKNYTARSNTTLDDKLVEMAEKYIIPFLFIFINYQIIIQLELSPGVEKMLSVGMMFVTTFFAIRLINYFIKGVVLGYMQRKGEPPERI